MLRTDVVIIIPLASGLLTMWAPIGDIGHGSAPTMVEPDTFPRAIRAEAPAMEHAHRGREPNREPNGGLLNVVMDRYARGDDVAFDELYRLAAPRVRGFLVRLCGDVALADDLTQETLLRVHRARGSFAIGAAALPWILAIARNAFRDSARRAQTRPVVHRAAPHEDDGLVRQVAPDAGGDEVLMAREMMDVVRRTLDAMPALQREAFVLLRFEGLSVSEAAQVLGATEGAVKVRAFRAYEALRAALDQGGQRPR